MKETRVPMYSLLANRWDTIRDSFWFLPAVMCCAAVGAALLCGSLNADTEQAFARWTPWVAVSASGARTSLATIGNAMVSIAGVVFSVMLVTLSITSSQYGSRLLRTFMSDRVTQTTLALLVSTSLFCMLALAGIRDQAPIKSTANVSVVVGLLLAVASIGVLIGFIHHVCSLLQAPNVVAAVASDLDASIDRLFPEQLGAESSPDSGLDWLANIEDGGRPIRARQEGYIQAVDAELLLSIAKSEQLFLKLAVKPGEFLERGQILVHIWAAEVVDSKGNLSAIPEPELTETTERRINEAIIAGNRRTPRQDAECALEELVEVAVRALSPGINDPFTAIACIDRLAACLGRVTTRAMPEPLRFDEQETPRVLARRTTFPDLMDAAFNQVRQHGCRDVAVAIRMVQALHRIALRASTETQFDSIRRHAQMLTRDFRSHVDQPEDGDDFQRRYDELMQFATSSAADPKQDNQH